MIGEARYDLVVVGGGMGGLAVSLLARKLGLRVALLEAHAKLGGCAGYFRRGPYVFDAGATALMGLESGEPMGDLLRLAGVPFEWERRAGYRVHLPDRAIEFDADPLAFERESARVFPGFAREKRAFWRLQAAVGSTLLQAADRLPRLPIGSLSDAIHDVKALGARGSLAAMLGFVTVREVLAMLGLDTDAPFRSFLTMLLQDTAQAGPECVPFANASACLQAYRNGMCRPRGGMRALAEGMGSRFEALGGDLRIATLVDRVERLDSPGDDPWFAVTTRRRQRLVARNVVFNLPLDLAAGLVGRGLEGRLGRKERNARAAWSAFTGYLAIDRSAVPDDAPLFNQVLRDVSLPSHDGNNVLISLSPLEDDGYGPLDTRVATMSTHARADEWSALDPVAHEALKRVYRGRMLDALARVFPNAPDQLRHEEFATPRSFARYTRRTGGLVGGPPVRRQNSNLLAMGSDVLGPGLWMVGDSVFPGQGTMAVVLSAIRLVERVTGISWPSMKAGARISATTQDAEPGLGAALANSAGIP